MKSNSSEWMSISDMMSGLMLVFMFIAISFMIQVQTIAGEYNKKQDELNKSLQEEFKNDFKDWNVKLEDDNTIIFNAPKVQFENNSYIIPTEFKNILTNFFPRYLKVLSSKNFKNDIEEIRIEGHTSKEKNTNNYLHNMQLSQDRANKVLSYCYLIDNSIVINNHKWLEKNFRANGMAYSHLKTTATLSRRVEFRVKLKAEKFLNDIKNTIDLKSSH